MALSAERANQVWILRWQVGCQEIWFGVISRLRSPNCFLGANISAAAAVGAKIGDDDVFSLAIFYNGVHGAFFDTGGTSCALFRFNYIRHNRCMSDYDFHFCFVQRGVDLQETGKDIAERRKTALTGTWICLSTTLFFVSSNVWVMDGERCIRPGVF